MYTVIYLWSCFLIGMENNAFCRAVAAFHLPKAMHICSNEDTTSGAAAALGLGWVAVIYRHPLGSLWFLQEPELNGGKVHQPCIRVFNLSFSQETTSLLIYYFELVWEEWSFRCFHLAFPKDQGISVGVYAFNCTVGGCGNDHWWCVHGFGGPGVSQTWARPPPLVTWNPFVLTLIGGPYWRFESPVINVKPDLVFNRPQDVWVWRFPRYTHRKCHAGLWGRTGGIITRTLVTMLQGPSSQTPNLLFYY